MSRLKNFIKNLQDPKDAGVVAAKLGISDLKAVTHPEISGIKNNINSEVVKMGIENVVLGHTASGQAITQADQKRDLYGWHTRCATFTEIGSAAYELMQSMTMTSAAAGICESNSDLDREIKRTKNLLAAVD